MASEIIACAAPVGRAAGTPPGASPLFAQAQWDNSNLELDWLWLATRVPTAAEQRFCYERALYINPASAPTRRALAAVANIETQTHATKRYLFHGKLPHIILFR